ncbi:hypothetical protein LINGRAHAP2_LOCUS36273 [Linum grandiflorum]
MSAICSFKYERLQTFCYICGIMGHVDKYCETHFHLPADKIIRKWDDSIPPEGRDSRKKQAERWLRNPTPRGGGRQYRNAQRDSAWAPTAPRPTPVNIQALQVCSGASLQTKKPHLAHLQRDMEEDDIRLETYDDRKRRREHNDHVEVCLTKETMPKPTNSPRQLASPLMGTPLSP